MSVRIWHRLLIFMLYKQGKRIFHNWLRANNLYEKYESNRRVTNTIKQDVFFRKHIGHYIYLIRSSFYWLATPEGYGYWKDVDKKWIKYIRKQEKRYT